MILSWHQVRRHVNELLFAYLPPTLSLIMNLKCKLISVKSVYTHELAKKYQYCNSLFFSFSSLQFTPSSPPHPSMRQNKPSLVEQRQHQHQVASPKTNQHFVIPPKSGANGSPVHTKIRSEGKKCRKVYGMDNRDLWCTQCRWKKACVRFT